MVDATFATFPEGFIVCQFIEGNRDISQFRIHFHDGSSAGEAEYFGVGPSQACQAEGCHFDTLSQSYAAKVGMYNQTGGGDVLFVSPAFDVGETCKHVSA